MSRLLAVALNTFRETVRERVLYTLVLFAVLMTLAGLLLRQLSIYQDEKMIKDVGLAAIDMFGSMIAIFIGVGLVSKEIERRSLYPLLAKPLSRDEFYLGKFLGLGTVLAVNVSAMTAGVYATLAATHRSGGLSLLRAVYPLYLSQLLIVAIAMLLSTATTSVLATIGTVCITIAGRYADVIRNMRDVVPNIPAWLIRGLYWALPAYHRFDFKNEVAYGLPVPARALGYVTLYSLVYAGILLIAGLLSFRRRELR